MENYLSSDNQKVKKKGRSTTPTLFILYSTVSVGISSGFTTTS